MQILKSLLIAPKITNRPMSPKVFEAIGTLGLLATKLSDLKESKLWCLLFSDKIF